ncbi:putative RNA polymerase II associated factor Paf1 [Helianthus annuus]|nr:putative RNA polymerase II associated factor Paf1 [Helianthus annuus]
MASYRPFPPPPPHPSGPPLPPPGGNMYTQMWNYPNYTPPPINPNLNHQQQFLSYPPQPLQPPQQPPPAGQMYYPPSQYPQFNKQSLQQPPPPPPPPSSSPPSSAIPPPPPPPSHPPSPPPPPSSISATNEIKEHRQSDHQDSSKDPAGSKRHEPSSHQKLDSKPHVKLASAVPPFPVRTVNKVEVEEEERRRRKKREMEKHRRQLKESHNKVMEKTQKLSSSVKPRGSTSISGSHMGGRGATPFLSGERSDNRLKKPTTFLCKLKFRDELPDTTAQPKLLSLKRDEDRAAKYAITSLEKVHKPQLYVEPDLGIPLDLLDLTVYNASKDERLHVAPGDEKLLQEDTSATPIKSNGLKRKERPTDKGMSWLVKTQYISPLSTEATRQSLSEKQAKELRETRGLNILDTFNSRERKIQDIEASFEACKSHPVHATNKKLQPVEILPLFPDFERWDEQFVVATFDGAPTADSESYNKMDKSVRDAHESQAIMKSFVASTPGSAKPDKFLAYMVPSVGELSKDAGDENEDISYTWVREYHWDVRGEDADDPTNYLVAFGESEARYMPLPTKLILRKKRAREGKTSDEVEHFPVPASITVRQRSKVSVEMTETEERNSNSGHDGRIDMEDEQRNGMQDGDGDGDMDQLSGAEYDMSD